MTVLFLQPLHAVSTQATMKTSRKVLRIYVTLKEHPDTFSYFNNLQKYNYVIGSFEEEIYGCAFRE